jgi:hypothetical protein
MDGENKSLKKDLSSSDQVIMHRYMASPGFQISRRKKKKEEARPAELEEE